jgi:hypothetical protein
MHAHGTPTATPGREWTLLILGGIVTVLIVFIAVIVLFRPQSANPPEGQPDARPVPAATPEPTPVPTPTAVIAPGTPTPESCDVIYSPEMVAAFEDLVLNPDWTTAPGASVRDGTDDPQLLAVIDATEHLTCRWVSPAGPSDSGVATNVVWVNEEQTVLVADRLQELGLDCYEELDGLRCITETTTDEGTFGESHFLRDGIWLATHFTNAGPSGYTHDMIASIWNGE